MLIPTKATAYFLPPPPPSPPIKTIDSGSLALIILAAFLYVPISKIIVYVWRHCTTVHYAGLKIVQLSKLPRLVEHILAINDHNLFLTTKARSHLDSFDQRHHRQVLFLHLNFLAQRSSFCRCSILVGEQFNKSQIIVDYLLLLAYDNCLCNWSFLITINPEALTRHC